MRTSSAPAPIPEYLLLRQREQDDNSCACQQRRFARHSRVVTCLCRSGFIPDALGKLSGINPDLRASRSASLCETY